MKHGLPVLRPDIVAPIFSLMLLMPLSAADKQQEVDFKQVRSILSDYCFHCHGPDASTREADLRLDTQEGAHTENDGITAVVPGDLDASELFYRIVTDDKDDIMPPPKSKKKLNKKQIELIRKWILEGGNYDEHWSFKKLPAKVTIPELPASKMKNPIDRFVQDRLKREGWSPAKEAAPEKWLRRASFDLTGLPPTIAELDDFLAAVQKEGEAAYAQEVDRLMATSAYAERMAGEWMDVARYSDSYGYQVDAGRYVWPWRDWVIRAFKKNMPYDQFVTEQLAGDLLPDATSDQRLATTFNRLHGQKVEGGSVEEEFRMEYVSDRVYTVGTAFMGLSMECTKCHDHKYDPLTQKDFFAMSAFFANIDEAGLYSFFDKGAVPTPALSLPTDAQKEALKKAYEAEGKALDALFAAEKKSEKAFMAWLKTNPSFELNKKNHVAHLNFEERVKNKFANLASKKQPASTRPDNQEVKGKVGKGVKLTGDDAINLPKGVGNFDRNQPFSLALWINSPKAFDRAVVIRRSKAWTDAASRGYEVLIEDGRLSVALIHFWPGNAIRVKSRSPLKVNAWQHIAMTYDGSSKAAGLNLYVDGELIETEVVRDNLSRQITGGDPFVGLGQRMRDRGFKNGRVDEFHVFARQLAALEVASLAQKKVSPTRQQQLAYFRLTEDASLVELRQQLYAARKKRSAAQQAIKQIMVMEEFRGKPRKAYILNRGAYDDRGDEVGPATPDFLPKMTGVSGRPTRLDFAKWLTSPNHPLMARVTVNRYWQLVFGTGLVASSEDFGSQGDSPTHPKLLDWLSRDFINHGWDLRHLLKQMVLSHTYRQVTHVKPEVLEKDPENKLLARAPSPRLTAEMLRDNALAVSKLLVDQVGGPSVSPYDLSLSFKPMKAGKGDALYRRSLYTYWKRTGPSPLMMTLDAAKRDVCTVKREKTATPLQSLVLMNGPQFVEAARKTAENLLHDQQSDEKIAAQAFRLLTSRQAEKRELAILLKLLREQQAIFSQDLPAAVKFISVGQVKRNKSLDPARLAAVTSLISTLMNFDECNQKR